MPCRSFLSSNLPMKGAASTLNAHPFHTLISRRSLTRMSQHGLPTCASQTYIKALREWDVQTAFLRRCLTKEQLHSTTIYRPKAS
ncbi:hypothetical protein PILCRDRAFT_238421 [Piloderma croceum F 1598]|uniref:Uncharacterized protein n=1 Tax=Piloderma croceum (strain F 1598) TaxID=765440 RepID=A0A0C3GDR0_PILCF|nr:hypothetical protein PILCRDRAFT_238421 [Piloderma croceum F 1598]